MRTVAEGSGFPRGPDRPRRGDRLSAPRFALSILTVATASCADWQRLVQLERQSGLPEEAPRFLESERILGAPVHDRENKPIGKIEDVLLDEASGRAVAILALFTAPEQADEPPEVRDYASLEVTGQGLLRFAGPAASPVASYSELFDGQEVASVQGEIQETEALGSGLARALVLKVRDEENLLHRVLVEVSQLVLRKLPDLKVGEAVRFEGVETRDEKGKLWIASALAQKELALQLRDPSGRILWTNLLQSARALLSLPVLTVDGATVPIRGWVLDRKSGAVSHLRLEIELEEHALPWSEVEREANGERKTRRTKSELQLLPPLPDPSSSP